MSEYDRRLEEILYPNQVSFPEVYAILGLALVAVAVVVVFVLFR